MKLLRSSKGIPIPKLFFISNREEIKDVPHGVPYIYGQASSEEHIVRILEYEVLYQRAIRSGMPFNFKKILKENGFEGIADMSESLGSTVFIDFKGEEEGGEVPLGEIYLKDSIGYLSDYIKDSSVYVDISVIKDLKIFPIWLETIEEAVSTNINNFAVVDSNMYNKKLDGMYGGIKLEAPKKNLIIIDISGSIPKAVSSVCLAIAQNLAESFYADLIITGSKSTLYSYEEISKLDIETIYDENGMDNDQTYFKKILSADERSYNTAIVFGDNHSPSYCWSNEYNIGTRAISIENGKKLNKWTIDKLISFHTCYDTNYEYSSNYVAGYADWFEPKDIVKIENWVKDLKEE